jgi:hypothetical protein
MMKIILLITVLESLAITVLLILWRFRSAYSKLPTRVSDQPIISAADNLSVRPLTHASVDYSRWVFINKWKVEPQADDRVPMVGSVAYSTASPSVRRSIARRRHQTMYKEWSEDRHD